jgi:hypothetical protein
MIGWLFGMHANLDTWWSQATMAYFFGMYVNGIAVYGRDPLLTCGYAKFITDDQRCPTTSLYTNEPSEVVKHALLEALSLPFFAIFGDGVDPMDWRNCSSKGYHP